MCNLIPVSMVWMLCGVQMCGVSVSGCVAVSLAVVRYIVYDVAQIRMKYLLKMKSNYKHSLF